MIGTNRLTFIRLGRLIRPFFADSEVKWTARGMLGLLALFALSIAGINVLLSYCARDFMTALQLKDRDGFFRNLGIYLLALALATPVTVFYSYTEQRLALLWRLWLSRQVLQKYFSNIAYYKIASVEGIDNPDQRLEEDIRSFTTTTLSLFLIFCNSCLTLVLFAHILWTISFKLVIAVFAYTIVGSAITYFIGRKLVELNFAQLKKEADYRYKLVNVRDNAESIAFYRGHKKELTRVRQKLKHALENFLRIINLNRNLNFFITLYNNIKPVLPIVIVAPMFLSGEVELGVVTQAADAFVRVVEALSVIIQHFGTISNLAAVVTRLGTFTEVLDETAANKASEGESIRTLEAPKVVFSNVTILTPKRDQTLVRDLTFEHKRGGLLITGGSGNGKSSILRATAGLWTAGSGTITRPPLKDTIFLPQHPYLVLGSLRNQLMYSLTRKGVSDRELESAMKQVGLQNTLERLRGLSTFADWKSILSAGEQQQLAFARLLLARPSFAFLDEATTAVDTETEKRLYSLLKGITTAFISIGYRTTLARYHGTVLELREDGTWKLEHNSAEESEQ